MDWMNFLLWERESRDTIDFKKIYVDVAGGDVIAGLVLSEIVYWHLPGKTSESKLRVQRKGFLWIAVRRYEWWDRTRLTPRQSDRALKILIDKKIIIKEVFKFDGETTTHVRLNWDHFLEQINFIIQNPISNPFLPTGEKKISNKNLPANHQTVNRESPKPTIPVTETTSEITSKDSDAEKKPASSDQEKPDKKVTPNKTRKKNPAEDHFNQLALSFRVDPKSLMENKSARSSYWKVANELLKSKFPVERVRELHQYVEDKADEEGWKGFTVIALSKYAPDFIRDNPISTNVQSNPSAATFDVGALKREILGVFTVDVREKEIQGKYADRPMGISLKEWIQEESEFLRNKGYSEDQIKEVMKTL